MDSFDNFQYDSASSYGGMGIVDDNSSVYTANTQSQASLDLENLSISDYPDTHNGGGHSHASGQPIARGGTEEDFDAILDDLKDESAMDLPPHACRYAYVYPCSQCVDCCTAIAASTRLLRS
jgi:regulator of nonsense transcripts 1